MKIQYLLYSIFIKLLPLAVALLALKDRKAKRWIAGRKNWKARVSEISTQLSGQPLWIHAASMGEYQMAIPLITKFLKTYPERSVVISFFSPSGYENTKVPDNCYKFYLPADTCKNNEYLLEKINPAALVFVKYDLWFRLIQQVNDKNIPLILLGFNISINKWNSWFYGGLVQVSLNQFDLVTVLDENKLDRFAEVCSPDKIMAGGDLRYRNVLEQVINTKAQPILDKFRKKYAQLIVCGSVWPADLEILAPIINERKDIGWIVAPHEIDEKKVNQLTKVLKRPFDLYSDLVSSGGDDLKEIIILNTIGDLFHSYRQADLAYVGGAFGSGLHNILEPAAFGKPVLFGPKIDKFPEASFFISKQIGASISNNDDLEKMINQFFKQDYFIPKKEILKIMSDSADQTDFIYDRIFGLL
ncbi:MAG: hypothetical protein EA362_07890 [Saprospirales bacterium]|nr:MAG: hypothetical protein EA362_07890 [Saprospirales bacterium]